MLNKNFDQRNKIIENYSKKIYGFAYSKVRNTYDAEDLSSEIILNICMKDWRKIDVQYMDAYIYKVCEYTWSKFLRKNKKEWQALNNLSLDGLSDDKELIDKMINSEETQVLRQEIVQLSKMRREIVINYYYDNKDGKSIAQDLGLSPSTVRWHLLQTKKELKMRMEMKDKTIHKPVQLWIGYYGWCDNNTYKLLESDVLLQNVCYLCRNKALSVEEISRGLGVASVYFEDKIHDMVKLDYMIKKRDKYKTNFFIQDTDYYNAHYKFQYDHLLELSKKMYESVHQELDRIKAIGFGGSGMPENELLWHLLPKLIVTTVSKIQNKIIQKHHLENSAPMRIDGTHHLIASGVYAQDDLEKVKEENPQFYQYCLHANGKGIKSGSNKVASYIQFDTNIGGDYRDFNQTGMMALLSVKALVDSGKSPSEYDKEVMSGLIADGYISHRDDQVEILIPYLTSGEMNELDKIFDEVSNKLLSFDTLFEEYIQFIDSYIPKHLSKNERNHYLTNLSPHYGVLYMLMLEGVLKEPNEEEKKRLCTMIWENE